MTARVAYDDETHLINKSFFSSFRSKVSMHAIGATLTNDLPELIMKKATSRTRKRSFLNNRFIRILFIVFSMFCLSISVGCSKKAETPLSLGYFTSIGEISISPDGDQILFSGCGHKDFNDCTIYRFEHSTGRLYRYVNRNQSELLSGGRYAPASTRFSLMLIPIDANNKKQFNDMQIALVNQNGTGLQKVARGKGVKVFSVLSPDEMTIAFFKGEERETGRAQAGKWDLYTIDISTGEETRLTKLSFYGVSEPYFTADGKNIVFAGDSPMRLPHTDDIDAVKKFRDDYWDRYHEHKILQYPLDGTGIDRVPAPLFFFDEYYDASPACQKGFRHKEGQNTFRIGGPGSNQPIITKNGSIWFEGKVGSSGCIYYFRRAPDGAMTRIATELLGISNNDQFMGWSASPDGRWLAILSEERRKGTHRSIKVLDTKTNSLYEPVLPSNAENIFIE